MSIFLSRLLLITVIYCIPLFFPVISAFFYHVRFLFYVRSTCYIFTFVSHVLLVMPACFISLNVSHLSGQILAWLFLLVCCVFLLIYSFRNLCKVSCHDHLVPFSCPMFPSTVYCFPGTCFPYSALPIGRCPVFYGNELCAILNTKYCVSSAESRVCNVIQSSPPFMYVFLCFRGAACPQHSVPSTSFVRLGPLRGRKATGVYPLTFGPR